MAGFSYPIPELENGRHKIGATSCNFSGVKHRVRSRTAFCHRAGHPSVAPPRRSCRECGKRSGSMGRGRCGIVGDHARTHSELTTRRRKGGTLRGGQYRASSRCWCRRTPADRSGPPCQYWRGGSRSVAPAQCWFVIICGAGGVSGCEARSVCAGLGRSLVGRWRRLRPQKAGASLRAASGPAAARAGPATGHR